MNAEIDYRFYKHPNKDELGHYASNRWYNFWSAKPIEEMFCSFPGVIAHRDEKNILTDFYIDGTSFDHKSSILPKWYKSKLNCEEKLDYAMKHPNDLIRWLYDKQSNTGRRHFDNKLDIVFYHLSDYDWKLKCELSWIYGVISNYMKRFNRSSLKQIDFGNGNKPLSDIIWAIGG